MNNEVFFILDRSGSMDGIESDTIGGYNSFLEKQRKDELPTAITTVLFDDRYQVLHNAIDIKEVKDITEEEYFVRGSTALLDAIGKTIMTAKKRIIGKPKKQQPENVIFVIITDGMENASSEYTYASIKELITLQENEHKWEFLFLGADLTNSVDADRMGIKRHHQAFYGKERTCAVFNCMAENVIDYKMTGKINAEKFSEIDEHKPE